MNVSVSFRVTLATGPSVSVLAQVKSDMRNLASVQLIRRPLNYENLTGISDQLEQFGFVQPSDPIITPTKSYVWWMNDPWAAFIALSAIVIVLGFIAIAILLYQWHRYVLTLTLLHIIMYYTPPQFLFSYLAGFKLLACFYKQSGNNVDPDQLASLKPTDLDLHSFLN